MIIDKIKPFWSEEDNRKLKEYQSKLQEVLDELESIPEPTKDNPVQAKSYSVSPIEKWNEYAHKELALREEVAQRYIDSFSDNTDGILADAQEIVDHIEREDFLELVRNRIHALTTLEELEPALTGEGVDTVTGRATESYSNCYNFIKNMLVMQFEALKQYGIDTDTIDAIIDKRVRELGYKATKEERKRVKATSKPESPEQTLSFSYPDTHQQNLTKASSKIFDSHIPITDLQQAEIDITPSTGKATTTFSVYVDMNAPELKGTENITEFDNSVQDAVISVLQTNSHGFFTSKQLATHLLYGDNPNNSNPSPQRVGAVTKCIEKQRHIDITVDWTEHAKLNKKIPEGAKLDSFKIKNYMLPVREEIAVINGQKVHGYRLLDEPPLYQYAKSVGQIAQHPAKMLNVPVNLDEQKIVIRDFLLKEIGHMKKSPHWNRTITIDRLLAVAGEESTTLDRRQKSRLIAGIRSMLDYWKSEKYIDGYEESTQGKTLNAITILL